MLWPHIVFCLFVCLVKYCTTPQKAGPREPLSKPNNKVNGRWMMLHQWLGSTGDSHTILPHSNWRAVVAVLGNVRVLTSGIPICTFCEEATQWHFGCVANSHWSRRLVTTIPVVAAANWPAKSTIDYIAGHNIMAPLADATQNTIPSAGIDCTSTRTRWLVSCMAPKLPISFAVTYAEYACVCECMDEQVVSKYQGVTLLHQHIMFTWSSSTHAHCHRTCG